MPPCPLLVLLVRGGGLNVVGGRRGSKYGARERDGWMDGNLGLVMGPTALALQTAPNTHASFVDFYQNGKAQIPSG